jgi:hypothetical protein
MAGILRTTDLPCAHCSCPFYAQVWRRVVGAAAAARSYILAWTISWLGFGLSD